MLSPYISASNFSLFLEQILKIQEKTNFSVEINSQKYNFGFHPIIHMYATETFRDKNLPQIVKQNACHHEYAFF